MTALENQQAKAWAIGPFAFRHAVTSAELQQMLESLPYSSRDRGAVTMKAFARAAYKEAGVDREEPHGAASSTWRKTCILLDWMWAHPDDPRVPPQDRLDDRHHWGLEAAPCPTRPTPTLSNLTSPASADAGTTSTSTTNAADASPQSALAPTSAPPDSPSGSSRSATAAGNPPPWVDADFPRVDGATCPCGAWHRRYGPHGHGALCDTCRARALEGATR